MADAKVTYQSYRVQPGDTLIKIAAKLWGNSARWKDIANANAISAPYTIRVGNTLLIPVQGSATNNAATKASMNANVSNGILDVINKPLLGLTLPTGRRIEFNIWQIVLIGIVVLEIFDSNGGRRG